GDVVDGDQLCNAVERGEIEVGGCSAGHAEVGDREVRGRRAEALEVAVATELDPAAGLPLQVADLVGDHARELDGRPVAVEVSGHGQKAVERDVDHPVRARAVVDQGSTLPVVDGRARQNFRRAVVVEVV